MKKLTSLLLSFILVSALFSSGFGLSAYAEEESAGRTLTAGLLGSDGTICTELSLHAVSGEWTRVHFTGLSEGETLSVFSADEEIARCAMVGEEVSILPFLAGETVLTLTKTDADANTQDYLITVTVTPCYTELEEVNLFVGEEWRSSDEENDYEGLCQLTLWDGQVASLTVEGTSVEGQEGREASTEEMSVFCPGQYIIGSEEGYPCYLLKSGSLLGTTADAEQATVWTVSGTASSATIKADGYFLCHGAGELSLSNAANNNIWEYSEDAGFYYTQSSGKWIWTTTSNHAMICGEGNSAGLSTAYTVTPSVMGIESVHRTDFTVKALREGTCAFQAGNKLTVVRTALHEEALSLRVGEQAVLPLTEDNCPLTVSDEAVAAAYTDGFCLVVTGLEPGETILTAYDTRFHITVEPAWQVITVVTRDDRGVPLAEDYTITGAPGESYTVDAAELYGYLTPAAVTGSFTDEDTGTVELIYILSANRNELRLALEEELAADGFTEESYSPYAEAVAHGRELFDEPRATQQELDEAAALIRETREALSQQVYYGYVTIRYVDDIGDYIRESATLSGYAGTEYFITPPTISDYAAPASVSGVYGKGTTETVTLVYTLQSDKTELEQALASVTEQGDYTETSYALYLTALENAWSLCQQERVPQSTLDNALAALTEAENGLSHEEIYGTVTVLTVDELGRELESPRTLDGIVGTPFLLEPQDRAGYLTPAAIRGSFTAEGCTVTLAYTLHTDKTALAAVLTSLPEERAYTAESYRVYQEKRNIAQAVLDNDRSTQQELDGAVALLREAEAGLLPYRVLYRLCGDGIYSGREYVIVNDGYALIDNDGLLCRVAVTAEDDTLADVDERQVWIITATPNGYIMQNKATGRYLGCDGSRWSQKYSPVVRDDPMEWMAEYENGAIRFCMRIGWRSYYLSASASLLYLLSE